MNRRLDPLARWPWRWVAGCLALVLGACSGGQSSTDAGAGAGSAGNGGGAGAGGTVGGGGAGVAGAAGGAGAVAGGNGGSVAGGAGPGAGGAVAGRGGNAGGAGAMGTGGRGGGAAGTGAAGGAGGANPGGAGGGGVGFTETTLARLPTIRQEHSVAAAAGEIYVIGGYTPGTSGGLQATDSVIAYDPAKNSWRNVKSFPVAMDHGNVGVIDDKIYVGGFFTNAGMTAGSTRVFVYDPATDVWTEKTSLRAGTPRGAGCVAIDAGLMYVFGGINNSFTLDYADRYNPATDTWQELPALPERKDHCAAAAVGGIISIVGGRVDGITNFQPKTWAFNPQTMMWTQKTSIPTPRGGLAGGVLGGKLYVFGGEGNAAATSRVFPNIDVYDPVADTWKAVGALLVPRHGLGGAVLGGKIYLPGGAIRQGGAAADDNSVFALQ